MTDAARSLSFAIISSAPAANALLEALCQELAGSTGLSFKPLVLRSYDKLVTAVRGGDVEIAWAPPLVALELEHDTQAKVLLCSKRAGRTNYSTVLFTRESSEIRSLGDIRGKSVAWVAKESSAGYLVPRMKLIAEGIDPDRELGAQTFRRTHEAVARAVLSGDSEVGATYASFGAEASSSASPVSAGWFDAGAGNDDVRILATAGPIPTDVIAVSSGLDALVSEKLQGAFGVLGGTVKQLLNADGFERPEATHLDELRSLVERSKRARAS